ncbi:GGDEF domain-containing protein [Shinella zoogloeoides]|uniref:GGDEF domain-containing protein n=1 Tax=Shinella zoogloeoides TaxID=352475 RepID=UPI000E652497|nr:GGDEF domain-containing protein [Shinella zoogloeoides]
MSYESVIALLNPAMSAIYCMSLLVLWRRQRQLDYIAIFALAYAVRVLCFGALYFAFSEQAPVLRQVANALILLSMMLLSIALSRRYAQTPWYGALTLIGAVTLAVLYFFLFVEPNLQARAVILNWGAAAICLLMLVDVARRPARTPVEQLLFGLVSVSCLIFLSRPFAFQIPGIASLEVESTYWLIVSISDALICSTLGVAIFAIIAVDVMDGIRAEAETDALSGLFNRRGFELRARDALARQTTQTKVALILGDLDHFKVINDRFGHGSGDRVIQSFAKTLKAKAPEGAIIGRHGGEEFVILLPSVQAAAAHDFAETVRSSFKDGALDMLPDGHGATSSFGVAIAATGEDLVDLLNRADRALYRAKAEGRDCVRLA